MVVAEIGVTLAEAFHLQGFEITDSNSNYLGLLTASTLAASVAGRKKHRNTLWTWTFSSSNMARYIITCMHKCLVIFAGQHGVGSAAQ